MIPPMGESDFHEQFDSQFGPLHASAIALKEMFDQYISVGFSEQHALQICLTQLAVAGLNSGGCGC